ncbi:MAG: hypothetical protein AAF572_07800, partial [Cyanobacteria bacterium P01_B01_bin.77]
FFDKLPLLGWVQGVVFRPGALASKPHPARWAPLPRGEESAKACCTDSFNCQDQYHNTIVPNYSRKG